MEDRLADLRGVRAKTKVTADFFGQKTSKSSGNRSIVFHIRSFMERSKNKRIFFDIRRISKKDYWKKRNWVGMMFVEKICESIERDY